MIGPDGDQLGVMPTQKALKIAQEKELDLVEIAPNATPPVCRIMDYGKYLYELQKKEKESKKKQHTIEVKEIRLRPKTDEHDLQTKLRHARDFLEKKNKVKFTVMFRGREMVYQEMGRDILSRVIEELEDIAKPEGQIKMEGRRMFLIMAVK
ncbi:MAG: translation initiation factor IF-3 [Calditrichia bacterium]